MGCVNVDVGCGREEKRRGGYKEKREERERVFCLRARQFGAINNKYSWFFLKRGMTAG